MFKKVMVLLIFPLVLFGANLSVKSGVIQAHTKVFGDTSINPSTKKIHADLSIQDGDIASLHGTLSFRILDFTSSKSSRDEHMQEMFEMQKYANIKLTIKKLLPTNGQHYTIKGILNMHGVNKVVSIKSTIVQKGNNITIKADFSVKVSDYGMKPPSLLLFTVRDRVDIDTSVVLVEN